MFEPLDFDKEEPGIADGSTQSVLPMEGYVPTPAEGGRGRSEAKVVRTRASIGPGSATAAKPLRILLIEDNPADARLISEYLSEDGPIGLELRWIDRLGKIEVHSAGQGVDVVLLDLFLPDSTGLGTVEFVLKNLPGAAVVVLTGLEDREASAEAIRRGAQDFLFKSDLHPAALVRSIRLAYERKRRDRELERSERELALVRRLMLDATEAADLEGAVARVLQAVCMSIGWAGGEAWIAEDGGTRLIPGPVSACGEAGLLGQLATGERRAISPWELGLGNLWSDGPIWIGDLREVAPLGRADLAQAAALRTAVLMPVVAGTAPAALLAFYHTEPLPEDPRLTSLLRAATVPLGAVLKRRVTEDLLRRSEEWRARLLDNASDGICILDGETRVTYVNGRACELLDRRAEDLMGRKLMEFLSEERAARVRRAGGSGRDSPKVVEVKVRSHRTFEDRWVMLSTSSIIDVKGVTEATLAMLTDITALKISEQAEAILADAGSLFSASLDPSQILRGLSDLIVPAVADWCGVVRAEGSQLDIVSVRTADPGRSAEVTAFIEALSGAPEDANQLLRALAEGELELDHPLASEADEPRAATGLPNPPPRRAQRVAVLPISLRDREFGVLVMAESGIHPAAVARRRALARELAHRAGMAAENATLYQEVNAALRHRDEVLGIVAHDLRNPLSAISMYASLLQELGSAEGKETWIRAIRRSAEHMDRLIQDLIDVAKLESGTLRIEKAPTHLPGLLGDLEEMFVTVAEERGLRLEFDAVGLQTRSIWADPLRLKQVLSNLLNNSIKYTPSGGTVSISARADEERVTLSVRDSGEGIAPEHVPHIFDRFWQPPSSKAGAGLGLAIAKGLTELHGGQITVESEVGKGTVFHVDLPCRERIPGPAADHEAGPPRREPLATVLPRSPAGDRSRPGRILIADDHEIFLSSLEELLRDAGRYETVGRARTAEEAVEMSRLLRPDLVLMDLDLPVQGGVAAIRQIASHPEPPRVLALTGNSEEESLVSAMDAGARGYLVKSASPGDLMNAIATVLNQGLAVSATGQRLLLSERRRLLERALDNPLAALPEQERMILALVAAGYTSVEIGKRLFLSPKTVDSYRSRLMRSLGVKHRSDLVHLAVRSGLLSKDAPL